MAVQVTPAAWAMERPDPRPPGWRWAFLIAAMVAGLLLTANHDRLSRDILVIDDLAADVLLTETGPGLLGHYSRFGFHHPGPFFFLLRTAAAWVAGDRLPAPYNAHLVAVVLTNALCIGGIAVLAAQGVAGTGMTAVAVAGLLLAAAGAERLGSAWMPNVLVLPFLLYLATLLRVAQGAFRLLPLTAAPWSMAMPRCPPSWWPAARWPWPPACAHRHGTRLPAP